MFKEKLHHTAIGKPDNAGTCTPPSPPSVVGGLCSVCGKRRADRTDDIGGVDEARAHDNQVA